MVNPQLRALAARVSSPVLFAALGVALLTRALDLMAERLAEIQAAYAATAGAPGVNGASAAGATAAPPDAPERPQPEPDAPERPQPEPEPASPPPE